MKASGWEKCVRVKALRSMPIKTYTPDIFTVTNDKARVSCLSMQQERLILVSGTRGCATGLELGKKSALIFTIQECGRTTSHSGMVSFGHI